MFKDPPVVAPMSPTASSRPLAICAGRSANPSDTAIDKWLLNYTYKAASMTKLSDINIWFHCLFAWQKCGSMHRQPKSVAIICSWQKALRCLHSEEQCKILQHAYSEELLPPLTLSLDLQVMAKENASLCSSDQMTSLVEGVSAHQVHLQWLYAQVNPRNLITIVDSGADLWIFGVGLCILHDWDELFFGAGAFFSSDTDEFACQLVTAAAVLYFPGTNIHPVLVHLHCGLHNEDPNQVESLASPHQMMAHGCLVDMVPMIHQTHQGTWGTQGMTDLGMDKPFTFDGIKLYMQHHEPTDSELNMMSAIDLTSSTEWKPWDTMHLARLYCKLLLVQHSWCLMLLSSDFNDVPQHHLASWLLMFCHQPIDETVASDWFHSDVWSAWWNKGFQVFTGKWMKIISVHCKLGKNHFVECLHEFCTDIGIPTKLVSDGEGSQNRPPVKEFCNSYLVQWHFSEAKYQNQNL